MPRRRAHTHAKSSGIEGRRLAFIDRGCVQYGTKRRKTPMMVGRRSRSPRTQLDSELSAPWFARVELRIVRTRLLGVVTLFASRTLRSFSVYCHPALDRCRAGHYARPSIYTGLLPADAPRALPEVLGLSLCLTRVFCCLFNPQAKVFQNRSSALRRQMRCKAIKVRCPRNVVVSVALACFHRFAVLVCALPACWLFCSFFVFLVFHARVCVYVCYVCYVSTGGQRSVVSTKMRDFDVSVMCCIVL